MKNYEDLTRNTEKKYSRRDRKKRPRMAVHGKQIFKLQEKMSKTAGQRLQKIIKGYKKT